MKARLAFRTLILGVAAPVVAAVTAGWALVVYQRTHRIIVDGFDRKLLVVAQASAALTDGDGHAAYQRRRTLVAAAPTGPSQLIGVDAAADELVLVDAITGSARRLAALPDGGVRGLASALAPLRVVGLTSDGTRLLRFDAAGAVTSNVELPHRLDGIFSDGSEFLGWNGRHLFTIDTGTGALAARPEELPDSLVAISPDPVTHRRFGLTLDRYDLLELTPDYRLHRRIRLLADAERTGAMSEAPLLHVIAHVNGRLLGVGASLFALDAQTGRVDPTNFSSGYFDPNDAFYRRHRAAFTYLQERAGLSYLYTQVYTGNRRIYYVLDGTSGVGYSPPGVGDLLPATALEEAERVQLVGRPWISPVQQWQSWGLLKSGFAPIRNSVGHVVAMTGADVDVGLIRQQTRWALVAAVIVGLCSFVAAAVISLRVASTLKRPVRQLKESALRLAAGYYSGAIAVSGGSEVASLSRALDELRARLEHEDRQSASWQEKLRQTRERTALVQALEDLIVRLGGHGSLSDRVGDCHAEGSIFWWFGSPARDSVESACRRARVVVLVHELLRAGPRGGDLLAQALAPFPWLQGVACWHGRTQQLHYRLRQPVVLHGIGGDRELLGRGEIACAAVEAVAWTPEAGDVRGTGINAAGGRP